MLASFSSSSKGTGEGGGGGSGVGAPVSLVVFPRVRAFPDLGVRVPGVVDTPVRVG